MRKMKDSGIEWVGEIPANWGVTRFKYIAKIKSNLVNPYYYMNYPQISPDNIQKNSGKLLSYNTVEESGIISGNHLFFKGQILYSKIRPNLNKLIIAPFNGLCSADMYPIETASYTKFVLYLMLSNYFVEQVSVVIHDRVKMPKINQAELGEMSVFVPEKQEQQIIADFLDAKCAEIDALSDDIRAQMDTLEQYKRSVIFEAVTKGLEPTVRMKDSGIKWIGQIPIYWKTMANKYVMKKLKIIRPIYHGENILSLTMHGVVVRNLDAGGKMPSSFNGYQEIFPGNLLMCLFDIDVTPRCIGLIKQNGLTSPSYSQFVLNPGFDSKYYYYYYMMLDNDKTLLHLAKNLRHSLTEEQLGAIPVVVPPYEEQQAIANHLDAKCAEIDTIIAKKQEQLNVLADYKKSLIYEYVTGKKEVPQYE